MEDQAAAALGVSVPVFRVLVSLSATIPCNWLWRFVPGPTLRHLYAALTGVLLSHYGFGFGANLHFLVPLVIGYASMVCFRRHCGFITFAAAFTFLIACHVYYMSGDAWKEGGMDCTGALMVLTLKVISPAMNYQDGLLLEDKLRPTQKKYRLLKLPSFLEYVGFCLACGTHLAGPVYEIQDYLDWTGNKGVWSTSSAKSPPSPYRASFLAFAQALLCMGMYSFLTPRVPLSKIFQPEYKDWGFFLRWGYQWLVGFTARWKYYFIWSISETAVTISGFGFTGWSKSPPNLPNWDRAKNIDIVGVELPKSSASLPLVWNVHVSTWLRLYVYERVCRKGIKPGLFELLITQTVSAVWHGLYAGYMLFFINMALMIAGSRVIYRWQQATPDQSWFLKKIGLVISLAYTVFVLNYACIGFLVLDFNETLQAYSSIYYAGTLLPVAFIIFGAVVKAPKPAKLRQEKAE